MTQYDEYGWQILPGGGIRPPTSKSYVPPAAGSTTSPYAGSPQTAAQKAEELGVADYLSNQNLWTDPQAYQNYTSQPETRANIQPQTTVPGQQQPSQYNQQIAGLVQQFQSAIGNLPTVDSIMASPAYQQIQQAVLGQMQQAMRGARADLAARGVLGEGSTPAVERMGQVAGHYGQQLGSLVPSMMGTALQMQGTQVSALQNLVNLLSGLDQQNWQRGMAEFQAYAPYTRLTASDRAGLTQWLINSYPQLSPGDAETIVNNWLQGGY